jgi:hypothetical protein
MRTISILMLLPGLFLLSCAEARAESVYQYVGPYFTVAVSYDPSFGVTTSNRITATWVFPSPLAPNLDWGTVVSPSLWSISDGVHTMTSSTDSLEWAVVSTTPDGQISLWDWSARRLSDNGERLRSRFSGLETNDQSSGATCGLWCGLGYAYYYAPDNTAAGTWTGPTTLDAVPEPGTISIVGALCLGALALRRARAAS